MPAASYLPWTDRAGRISTLKLAVFCVALLPALMTLYAALTGNLGPRPITAALRDTGDHAVWLLLASLAVTPLRRIGNWPKLILVRRMLGLFALAYTVLHVTLFLMDKGWSLWALASEIVLRFYLTIGFVTLLGLVALGVTSNEASIRRLGAKDWNRLHAIVYWLAVLALIHFFLQSKTDISQTLWAAGLFGLLMGARGINRRNWPFSVPVLLGLALAGTISTAMVEASYYAIKNNANWWMVLANNLDPDLAPRPALIVALAGLALAGVKLARGDRKPARTQRGSSLTPSEASASQ